MRLIDTHCHLCHQRLAGDIEGVLSRAASAGVDRIICAVGDVAEASAAAKLCEGREQLRFTAGVHPHEAANVSADYLDRLAEFAASPAFVAIGEIGLDYHYNFSPPEIQRRVFAEQLSLAARLGRPVVVHMREAFDDTLAIMRDSGADLSRALFHSFTEPPAQAAAVLELGAMISFSGIVTFKNADELRKSASMVPDDRIMIETDSPYLSPEPMRKMKTNEPANVVHVASLLAKLRGVAVEQLAATTTANAERFFRMA